MIEGIVAIRGCNDAEFVARHIARDAVNPTPRHFPKERIICTNFEGSEKLRDWLGNVRWKMIEGQKCGFFKEVK